MNVSSGQEEVRFLSDLRISGNISMGQDTSVTATPGMIRFDTFTNLFLGYNGEIWIDLVATGSSVNTKTDTLEIGDSYGGGIVFYTLGSN